MKKTRLTIWLDSDLAEWISKKAEGEDRSRNNMVVVLLKRCRQNEKQAS